MLLLSVSYQIDLIKTNSRHMCILYWLLILKPWAEEFQFREVIIFKALLIFEIPWDVWNNSKILWRLQ